MLFLHTTIFFKVSPFCYNKYHHKFVISFLKTTDSEMIKNFINKYINKTVYYIKEVYRSGMTKKNKLRSILES